MKTKTALDVLKPGTDEMIIKDFFSKNEDDDAVNDPRYNLSYRSSLKMLERHFF